MSVNNKFDVSVMTWRIGKQIFGMDVKYIKEVVNSVNITEVPYAKEYISGVANLRGEIITVINLAKRLGYNLDASDKKEQTAIVRLRDNDRENVSLEIEEFLDIMDFTSDQLENPPGNFGEIEGKFIDHLVSTNVGVIIILNAEEILKHT